MADPITQALTSHSAMVDQTVSQFLSDLDHVLLIAQAQLSHKLIAKLVIGADGKIAQTVANQRLLRRIPALWQDALDEAGLEHALERYMASFPRQIPEFQQILQTVNQQANEPLPLPKFTQTDMSYFNSLKLSSGSDLAGVIEHAAQSVITRSIYAVGGISFRTLVQNIIKTTDAVKSRATAIAGTSLMGFFRSVAQSGYQSIEEELGHQILYDYVGPDDLVTRPMCHVWVNQSKLKPFTRSQIDGLNNGTLYMPVWVFGGGVGCRHSILASLRQ